jgi:hypothetical protein
MDMGQDVARATQALGGAVSQTAGVLDAYDDKRAEQRFKAATADLQLKTMEAEGKVEEYMMKNPSDTEGLLKVKNESFAGVWDQVNKADLRSDDLKELEMQKDLISKKQDIKWGNTATKIGIANDNAVTLNLAEAHRRAGNSQEAYDEIKNLVASDEYKMNAMRGIFSEGVQSDLNEQMRSLYDAGDLDGLRALSESVMVKGEDGRYVNYEYTVMDNGKPVPAGGISEAGRKYARDELNSKIRRLEVAGIKGSRRAIKGYYKDELMSIDPNLPVDVKDQLSELLVADTGKLGITSASFLTAKEEIAQEIDEYDSSADYLGMSDADRRKLWKNVKNGGYTEAAQMQLTKRLLMVEEMRAGQDEARGQGFKGFFIDPDVPTHERRVKEALVSRYTKEADAIINGLGEGTSGRVLSAFLDSMDELESRMSEVNEGNVDNYIQNVLPVIYRDHLNELSQEAVNNGWQ